MNTLAMVPRSIAGDSNRKCLSRSDPPCGGANAFAESEAKTERLECEIMNYRVSMPFSA